MADVRVAVAQKVLLVRLRGCSASSRALEILETGMQINKCLFVCVCSSLGVARPLGFYHSQALECSSPEPHVDMFMPPGMPAVQERMQVSVRVVAVACAS